MFALERLNSLFFSNDDAIQLTDFSFPKTKGNYKGSDTVDVISLPEDMPSHTPFESVTVSPSACVALKCKMSSSDQKVFINVCCHDEVPHYPIEDVYLFVGKRNTLPDKDTTLVTVDVLISSGIWAELTQDGLAMEVKEKVHYLQ